MHSAQPLRQHFNSVSSQFYVLLITNTYYDSEGFYLLGHNFKRCGYQSKGIRVNKQYKKRIQSAKHTTEIWFVAKQWSQPNNHCNLGPRARIERKRAIRAERKKKEIKDRIKKRNKRPRNVGWDAFHIDPLLRAGIDRMGWKSPTKIQEDSFIPIRQGRNVRSINFVIFSQFDRWFAPRILELGKPQLLAFRYFRGTSKINAFWGLT